MQKFGKSQSVKRVEDVRFLTGQGRYVDDIAPKGALHGFVLRSSYAHGKIAALDVEAARAAPGVALVLTAADIVAAGFELGMKGVLMDNRDGTKGAAPLRPVLATDTVRYVGEAVAFVVATTIAQAKDAAELVGLEIDDLPVKLGLEAGGQEIHAEAPGNIAYDYGLGEEAAVADALSKAAQIVTLTVPDNRIIVCSMEPRGSYAEIEDGRLHVCINGQGVWAAKSDLVHHMKVSKEDIRVTNPDVGGGFGMKGMMHPEAVMVAFATQILGVPVRWMSERTEAMLADNGGRDLSSTVTMGFDTAGKITAYKVENVSNMGAYNSGFAQAIQSLLFTKVMPGTYDIPCAWLHSVGFYTNTNPVDAYRGAGRPEAIYVLERAMDQAARELGIDPLELRRRNFIAPSNFPYTSATGVTYDVGEFGKVLSRAEEVSDIAGFAARRSASEARGLRRGLGLCYYIESILGDTSEVTTVVFDDDGRVQIHAGTQSNGQGHETVYAQFLSDQTGIPADQIRLIQGDSDIIPRGGGTGGSRSVTVQNAATLATVAVMVENFAGFLADREGVDPNDVSFDDERFRIAGSNLTPTMLEVAALARADGRADLKRFTKLNTLASMSFPNGAHFAEVEVDPATGKSLVVKYTVTDDFGNLINPMLAEGQVHGGVAQGIGQAMSEHVVYDEQGQLLTASFMDYALPRADEMPMIGFHTEPTPSLNNPMGMKGCGEAGTVGALAAVTNAMLDALAPLGVNEVTMPFTPHRVWEMINEGKRAAS